MKDRIYCIIITYTSLLIGSLILFIFSDNPFLRGFVSDIIAVIFIYYVIRLLKKFEPVKLASIVLLFAFSIEILQYYKLTEMLNISNNFFKIVLGSTYDPLDFLAYLTGVIISFYIDISIIKNRPALFIYENRCFIFFKNIKNQHKKKFKIIKI